MPVSQGRNFRNCCAAAGFI